MKRMLLLLLLITTAAVYAQQQAVEDEPEALPQTEGADGEAAADTGADDEAEDPPPVPQELLSDDEIEELEVPEDEVEIATGDSEFTPEEEISEDFPVPLPSDI